MVGNFSFKNLNTHALVVMVGCLPVESYLTSDLFRKAMIFKRHSAKSVQFKVE